MSQVDYADLQGLLRFGYGGMTRASYVLVRVKDPDAAKAWLRSAPVTTAVAQKPPPKTAMNIAFTAPGLKELGVPDSILAGFSHEFRGGMGQESRARQLGDVGGGFDVWLPLYVAFAFVLVLVATGPRLSVRKLLAILVFGMVWSWSVNHVGVIVAGGLAIVFAVVLNSVSRSRRRA